MPRFASPWVLACLLPLPGCCSLARLFCGPDRSAWVQIDYGTPTATVSTLLEAIRRDAADVVYDCLAAEYRRELGLDRVAMAVAWQRLRSEVPGLHLAGYATVPTPTWLNASAASMDLQVEGRRLGIQLVREDSIEIRWRRADGSDGRDQQLLKDVEAGIRLQPIDDPDFDRSQFELRPLLVEHEGEAKLLPEQVQAAGFQRRWKIRSLQSLGG